MEQEPRNFSRFVRQKKWLLIAVAAAVVLILVIVLFAVNRDKPQTGQSKQESVTNVPKNFAMTTDGKPVQYAGNAVYDACGLISFDTFRSTVNNYQALLDMNGTDKKPSEPLSIEHNYFDRDMPTPLGKDGQPRSTSTKVGGEVNIDSASFISESDSNCWYGQGDNLSLGLGKTFAKVYVTQRPTPLSGDLTKYLATLSKTGTSGDVAVYVEPKTDAEAFFTGIIANEKKGVVAFVKASTQDLAQKATTEASEVLSKESEGSMNMTYPLGWSKMPNPCSLFSANDFQQATGKPASALAEDKLTLNEIGGRMMQRSCERLELERLDNTPIAKTTVVVRMGANEKAAQDYVNTIKTGETSGFNTEPLKQKIALADDAYIAMAKDKGKENEIHMRIGQAVVILSIATENGPMTNATEYGSYILPFAQKVAEQYRQTMR